MNPVFGAVADVLASKKPRTAERAALGAIVGGVLGAVFFGPWGAAWGAAVLGGYGAYSGAVKDEEQSNSHQWR